MGFKASDLAGMSARCKDLLLRRDKEDFDAEWKESVAGLDAEDLVAFANSSKGGAILLGVVGKTMTIKNTPLTDPLKTTILDKARSCFPPVSVEIFAERGKAGEVVRIEIPSGEFKPYCTHGGTYKIRGDGANAAIKPPALLQMFLEREGSQFLARFTEATRQLEGNVLTLKTSVEGALQDLYEDVRRMDDKIEHGLGEAVDQATQAVNEAEESKHAAQSIDQRLEELEGVMLTVRSQAEVLLEHHGLEDPRDTRIKAWLFPAIERLWDEQPRRRRVTYLKLLQGQYPHLNPDYLAQLYDQKAAEVKPEK